MLLGNLRQPSNVSSEAEITNVSAHGELHTLCINPSVGATGTLNVLLKTVGSDNYEALQNGSTPVVIDLTAPISHVFWAAIQAVKTVVASPVTGDYTLVISSHGEKPENCS